MTFFNFKMFEIIFIKIDFKKMIESKKTKNSGG